MNMKTTKFLAVLAVLAMAFAVVSVATTDSDAADVKLGEVNYVYGEGTDKFPIAVNGDDTLSGKQTGNTIAVSGIATTQFEGGLNENEYYTKVSVSFNGTSDLPEITNLKAIKIVQENFSAPFMNGFSEEWLKTTGGYFVKASGDNERTSIYGATTFNDDNSLDIMIPQDGSAVTLKICLLTSSSDFPEETTAVDAFLEGAKTAGAAVTIVIDFSKTTTKVSLSDRDARTDSAAKIAVADSYWEFTTDDDTLVLKDVVSNLWFDVTGDLNVKLIGDSVLTPTVDGKNADGNPTSAGIMANGNLTIVSNNEDDASLSVLVQNSDSYGIWTTGSKNITIGSATFGRTAVTTSGSVIGIYTNGYGAVTIDNADVTAVGSEKAISSANTDDASDVTITGKSVVNALLDMNYVTNHGGEDDFYGIKCRDVLTVEEESVLNVQGLYVKGTITNDGKIFVTGGYVNKADYVAGINLENTTAPGADITLYRADKAGADEGKIYISDDAEYQSRGYYTITVIEKDGKKDVQTTAADNAGIQAAIDAASAADVDKAVVLVTATENDLAINTLAQKGVELRTAKDVSLTGTVTVKGEGTNANTVTITSFVGAASFSYGSIVMGIIEWDGGSITLANGDVLKVFSGTAGIISDVTITGPTGENESATVIVEDGQSLTVAEPATLTITGNVSMNNDGAIIGEGTIYVDDDATFYTAKPVSVYFEGDGTIITEDAMETLKISDKLASSIWALPTQKVLVTGNLAIKAGQYLVVTGELEIPVGITVTIEEGGLLMLEGPTATAVIDGTIKATGVSTSTDALLNGNSAFTVYFTVTNDVEINGEIIAAKSTTDDVISVDIDGKAIINGKVTINPKAAANFGLAEVSEYGQLVNNGTMSGTVYNAGTVIINGKVSGSALELPTIYMAAADAVVDVQALKSGDEYGSLVIDDTGMYMMSKVIDGKTVPIVVTDNNKIVLENVGGLKVTEGIYYYYVGGERFADNMTYVEGTLGFGDSKVIIEPTVTISEGTVTVATTLDIAKAQLIVEADLSVLGTITVDNSETYKLYDGETVCVPNIIVTGGDTTAYGLIQVTGNALVDETYINAVLYEKRVESKTVYYYTNLTDAIASGATEFEVLGELYVIEDTTIPAGVNVDAAGHDVYIGSAILYPDVTLTVANGGSLSAGSIEVAGTLYIANTDSGISCSNIISDTSNIGESDALYTNIYKALSTAESGDVVKITKKNDGTVSIEKDATVASGVTLIVPASKTLQIYEGTTLTINGFLQNKGTITAVKYDDDGDTVPGEFAEKVDNGKYAVIKVNGMIESMSAMPYKTATGGYFIAGAYYAAKTLYYISTVEAASLLIQSVDSQTIDINGTVAVDDVAFIGSDSKPVIVNINGNTVGGGSFTADTITYNDATINFTIAGLKVNGTFNNVTGSVTLANVQTTKVSSIGAYTVSDGDEVMDVLYVAGGFKHSTSIDDMKNAPKMTFDGAVLIKDSLTFDGSYNGEKSGTVYKFKAGSITVASDAVVAIADVATFTGSLTVKNAAVTINGSLTIYDGGDFSADTYTSTTIDEYGNPTGVAASTKNASVNVYGIFSALDTATEDAAIAGTVTITGTVSVGSNDISDAAMVDGKVKPDVLVVYPGSIITGDLLADISKPSAVYTEFYIEGDLWKTIYNLNNSTLDSLIFKNISTKLTDRMFDTTNHWMSATGSKYLDTKVVGDYQKAYANILYNIYSVTIYTDAGVKSVSIDGIELWNEGTNKFVTPEGYELIAGTHTVSYTMKDGYSGTPTLKTSDGIILKDYKFLTTGTDADDRAVFLQLNGTDPTPEPEPEPVTPEEKSEWTITTILLCVLVVLIAIMAVIVALRLNRN